MKMSELIDISRPEFAWEIVKAFPEDTAKKIASILEAEPKVKIDLPKQGHWEPEIKHYFDVDNYGELEFYANIVCSCCNHRVASVSLKSISRPDLSEDEDWDIDPYEFYDEQEAIVRGRIYNGDYYFGKYCTECGAKMNMEDE